MKKINELYQGYLRMPEPAKASFWFMICTVLQKGISMVTMPIFTRIMSPEHYGVVSVYNAWYGILSIFATLNLSAGVFNKGMIKYETDKSNYVSSMLGLAGTATILMGIIYLINPIFWEQTLQLSRILIITMLGTYFFESAFALWAVYERFHYHYKYLVLVTIATSIFSSVFSVIVVLNTQDKGVARIVSTAIFQSTVYAIIYIMIVKKSHKLFNKKYWVYALKFNIPLIPHYLSMTVLGQADRIMISDMVGSGQAAIYGVAYNISTLMTIITNAISGTYVPFVYRSIKDRKYSDIKKITNLLLAIVAVCCMAILLFGPEIIRFFAPREYYAARWVIPPISISIYFIFLYQLFGNIEFYFEKTKFVMVASCVGAGTNILLNFIFISRYGFVAAAYTSLVCYILFSVMHYIFSKRVLKQNQMNIDQLYDMKGVSIISIALLVFMIIFTVIYDLIVIRYTVILIITCVVFINIKRIYKYLALFLHK